MASFKFYGQDIDNIGDGGAMMLTKRVRMSIIRAPPQVARQYRSFLSPFHGKCQIIQDSVISR